MSTCQVDWVAMPWSAVRPQMVVGRSDAGTVETVEVVGVWPDEPGPMLTVGLALADGSECLVRVHRTLDVAVLVGPAMR